MFLLFLLTKNANGAIEKSVVGINAISTHIAIAIDEKAINKGKRLICR